MEYGYIRVSTLDQNEDRQRRAMAERGVPRERMFIDKQSGKDFHRPPTLGLLRRLRPGDLVYVLSIDRLGRNYEEVQNQWRVLTKEKAVDICCHRHAPAWTPARERTCWAPSSPIWCCKFCPSWLRTSGRTSKNARPRASPPQKPGA